MITGAAKLISAVGEASILQASDPILGIQFRYVLGVTGLLELLVALLCFIGRRVGFQAWLVAWLATCFLVYRLGLLWLGYQKPCSCLGNLTDAMQITPQTADNWMKVVLAYLLFGNYMTACWVWRDNAKLQRQQLGGISVTAA